MYTRVLRRGLTIVLAAAFLARCDVLGRSETALIEAFGPDGLGADRTWAMRLTVLEFGDEVGGFVEYFPLDGIYNTATQPYVVAAACSYFGPVPNRGDSLRIVADGIAQGAPLVMQLGWTSGRRNTATTIVEQDGGLDLLESDRSLLWERDTVQRPERRCGRGSELGAADATTHSDVDASL